MSTDLDLLTKRIEIGDHQEDLLRELLVIARSAQERSQTALQSAVEVRDSAMRVITQLAEIAHDGLTHLDADEYEVTRHALSVIASAPTRMGIAAAAGRPQ